MRSRLRRTLLISADPLSSATIADQARMPMARGDLRGRRPSSPGRLSRAPSPNRRLIPGARGAAREDGRMTAPPNSRFLLHPSPVGEVLIVTTDEGIVTLHPLRDRLENELERLSRVLRSIPDRADDDAVAARRRPAARRVLRRRAAGLRPAAGLAARPRVHARRARGRPRHPVRRDGGLRRGRRDAGSPRAARAVGTACATTPFSIVVPVHRVVRADGSHRRVRRAPRRQGVPAGSRTGRERVGRSRACGPGALVPRARTSCGASGSSPSPPRSR